MTGAPLLLALVLAALVPCASDRDAFGWQAEGGLSLNDLDKVNFVLGNIQNHFDGVGGPDNVIALVTHGQALKAFHPASANPDATKRVGQFSQPVSRWPPAATP